MTLGAVYGLRSLVMYARHGQAVELVLAALGFGFALGAGIYLRRFRHRLRAGGPRVVALMAFLVTAVSGGAMKASADGDEPKARLGLTASLPAVDVSRFPLGEPFPMPQAELEPARLRMVALDGTPLLDVRPFDGQGNPIPEAFSAIERAFAARSGATTAIDPRLVELLVTLSAAFDGKPIKLVSAHREKGAGTRKTSYHVKGMAADILIEGVKVHDLREAALRLGAGGVGVYPSFVHVDSRKDEPYSWVGSTYARWRYVRAQAEAMRRNARQQQAIRMARARARARR
jgi:hypothetical protein